jgi:hypothetical protein
METKEYIIAGALSAFLVVAAAILGLGFGMNNGFDNGFIEGQESVVIPEPDYSSYETQIETLNTELENKEETIDDLNEELNQVENEISWFKYEYEDDINEAEAWRKAKSFIADNYIHELNIDDWLEDNNKEDWSIQFTILEYDINEDNDDFFVEALVRVDYFDEDGNWNKERNFEFEVEVRESGILKNEDFSWE